MGVGASRFESGGWRGEGNGGFSSCSICESSSLSKFVHRGMEERCRREIEGIIIMTMKGIIMTMSRNGIAK